MNIKHLIIFSVLVCLLGGCRKFLDEKPAKDLAVPGTIEDLQALLDHTNVLNVNYPYIDELAADNYYIATDIWQARPATERNAYIWEDDVFNESERNAWSFTYTVVYNSNVVLDELKKESFLDGTKADRNYIRAQALFFRSFAFYNLLQVFAKPYDPLSSYNDLGIALRLSSDLNIPTSRASVKQSYDQVIADLKEAAKHLPVSLQWKTRPSRQAAYGLLARALLAMEDYEQAGLYADSALRLQADILDYNFLNTAATRPVPLFNEEVIFHSVFLNSTVLTVSAKVDTLLYQSYDPNDLRKLVFFNTSGGFKGSYDGSARMFNGLTCGELYLIRAECRARQGDAQKAMEDLNTLLQKRWKTGTFTPIVAADADEALETILEERRKELVFRGLRWADLRRLNKDPRFAKTLVRVLDNQIYTLPPGDPQYVFPLPVLVVQMTGVPQNER